MEKNNVNALDNNIKEINDINDMLENNKIEDQICMCMNKIN